MSPLPSNRLLVISQVYPPDPAAVGQYVADAAEEMVRRGWHVVVYTAANGYDNPAEKYPSREQRNGVDVRRLPLSSFGKRSIAIRLAAQTLFVLQAFTSALFAGRFSTILVSTSPPFAGACGALLSILKRSPFVWWAMDLNPDQMIAAGKTSARSFVARVFDWLNRITIRRARDIVVLDRFMKERVIAKLPGDVSIGKKISVIAPWSLDSHLGGDGRNIDSFRREHGLEGKFVVMYAGNHSEQNPLGTLLDAAERIRDLQRVVFVFVGGGGGKAEVERRIFTGSPNIVSLPFQPIEKLSAVLGAADVHVVSIGDSMVGIVHPCKIYSAMAVGRPIMLLGPKLCHASEIMAEQHVGWHVSHGDDRGMEAAVREAAAQSRDVIKDMGMRAAELVGRLFSRQLLIDRFAAILERDGHTP